MTDHATTQLGFYIDVGYCVPSPGCESRARIQQATGLDAPVAHEPRYKAGRLTYIERYDVVDSFDVARMLAKCIKALSLPHVVGVWLREQ